MASNTTNNAANGTGVDDNLTLTLYGEKQAVQFDRETLLLTMASCVAPTYETEERETRAAIDITCVIDRSGSMAGKKLALLKETLDFLVQQLKPEDRLGLVVYDDTCEEALPLTKMNQSGQDKARASVKKIQTRGCTNLSGGLLMGLDQLRKRGQGGGGVGGMLSSLMGKKSAASEPAAKISACLLLTDGLANVGIQNTAGIVRAMNGMIGDIEGAVSVFTFGYGADHNADMLRGIADAANGSYYFVENEEQVGAPFADCLGGLMSVAAQNIELRLEPLHGATIAKVDTQYPVAERGAERVVTLRDLYSEERRDVVTHVTLPACAAASDAPAVVLRCHLSYFNVVTSRMMNVVEELGVARPAVEPANQEIPAKLDEARNRLNVARALEEAQAAGDRGDWAAGQAVLQRTVEELETSATNKSAFTVSLARELEAAKGLVKDSSSYYRGKKKMASRAHAHAKQRSVQCEYVNDSDDEDDAAEVFQDQYMTSAKVAHVKKAKKSLWRK